MARYFLLVSDRGINTRPVRADDAAALAQELANEAGGESIRAAAIELVTIADVVAGTPPQAFVDRETNRTALAGRAQQALTGNTQYLGHAAIPSGTLTAAQLTTIVKTLSDQVDALTRQNNALIRLAVNQTDTVDNT